MAKGGSKKGPPNHLKAWREFPMPGRGKLTQEELAAKVKTSKSVISELESSDRGLSHKWAAKLAPHLWILPGWLLDHDPRDMNTDVLSRWTQIPEEDRPQVLRILDTYVRKGNPPAR